MFFDRFIHPDLQQSAESSYRARVLVGILLVYSLIVFLTIIYIVTVAPIPRESAVITTLLLTLLIGAYMTILFVLRQYGAYEVCGHITTAVTTVVVAAGIAVSGGPLVSPATPVNMIPIILAFVLMGKREGLIWAQWVLLIHFSMILLGAQLIHYPQLLDMRFMAINHGVHWAVTYGAIIGLMMVFDSINARLKKERDDERSRFAYLASHDFLTDLPNRVEFDEQLAKSIARASRSDTLVALLYLDLDGFKPVNDKLGHDVGDMVLKTVSERLRKNTRANDSVARLGGDEFAVILEGLKDTDSLNTIVEKIKSAISAPIAALPPEFPVTASIGVAVYPRHTRDETQLMKFADIAMYEAKKEKDHWCLYSPAMNMFLVTE